MPALLNPIKKLIFVEWRASPSAARLNQVIKLMLLKWINEPLGCVKTKRPALSNRTMNVLAAARPERQACLNELKKSTEPNPEGQPVEMNKKCKPGWTQSRSCYCLNEERIYWLYRVQVYIKCSPAESSVEVSVQRCDRSFGCAKLKCQPGWIRWRSK